MKSLTELEQIIERAWEARASISTSTEGEVRNAVKQTMDALDAGTLRVAEKKDGEWQVNQWAKQAVLPLFPFA